MNSAPYAPPPTARRIMKERETLASRLTSLPERFWDYVTDTVDVNHDELLAFFSFSCMIILNAMALIMMLDYDEQRRLILFGVAFCLSTLNSYLFFSKTRPYQLFNPNVEEMQHRSNVDVIKIPGPLATGGSANEDEKAVWVLHAWRPPRFNSIIFKWASPVAMCLWFAGRDQARGIQLFLAFCIILLGWQLQKLVDSYETALEDNRLIASELNLESEQAAYRHFARTKKDMGSQTDSIYSRPTRTGSSLPTAAAVATSNLYRPAPPRQPSPPSSYTGLSKGSSFESTPLHSSTPLGSAWGTSSIASPPSYGTSSYASPMHGSQPITSSFMAKTSPLESPPPASSHVMMDYGNSHSYHEQMDVDSEGFSYGNHSNSPQRIYHQYQASSSQQQPYSPAPAAASRFGSRLDLDLPPAIGDDPYSSSSSRGGYMSPPSGGYDLPPGDGLMDLPPPSSLGGY